MEINFAKETSEGSITFQGTLNPEEVNFVIETGLNFLLQQGALPFASVSPDQMSLNFNTDEH